MDLLVDICCIGCSNYIVTEITKDWDMAGEQNSDTTDDRGLPSSNTVYRLTIDEIAATKTVNYYKKNLKTLSKDPVMLAKLLRELIKYNQYDQFKYIINNIQYNEYSMITYAIQYNIEIIPLLNYKVDVKLVDFIAKHSKWDAIKYIDISEYLLPAHISCYRSVRDSQYFDKFIQTNASKLRKDTANTILGYITADRPINWATVRAIIEHFTPEQRCIDRISLICDNVDIMKHIYRRIPDAHVLRILSYQIQDLFINNNMPTGIYFLVNRRNYTEVKKALIKGVDLRYLEEAIINEGMAKLIVKYIPIDMILERYRLARKLANYITLPNVDCDVCITEIPLTDIAGHACSFNYCKSCGINIGKCNACGESLRCY